MKQVKLLTALLSLVTFFFCTLASAYQYERLLVMGNSMAFHYPNEQISWKGSWGMAASKQENDYSHKLQSLIAKNQRNILPKLRIENVSDFERNSSNYLLSKLSFVSEYKPDIVVIFLGDNVKEDMLISSEFPLHFNRFVATVKNASHAEVFCVSTWWASMAKDKVIKSTCESLGAIFVDISDLNLNPKNRGGDISMNPGVAAHPGDRGMNEIAHRITDRMTELAK